MLKPKLVPQAVKRSGHGSLSLGVAEPHILGDGYFRSDTCDKCKNANPIGYRVEPAEAWRIVVLNRWRRLSPGCFDVEAEKAGVRYSFVDLDGVSWSDRPVPKARPRRKR